MFTVRINPSHQKDNKCTLGDTEADHMKIIAKHVYRILLNDGLIKPILIGDAPSNLSTDKGRLKWSIATANKAKADLHLGLHSNAGGGHGVECIHYSDDPKYAEGKKAALRIQNQLGKIFYKRKVFSNKNLAELNDTNCPAVIVEAGFHDYTPDARLIHSKAQEIAELIVIGVYEHFDIQKKLYRVQVGAFYNLENARNLASQLEKAGFKGVIV